MDPSLFRVFEMKEPGEASRVDSSFVLVRVCALLLRLSMVLSSSVLEADAEVSRLFCECLVRVGCKTGEWAGCALKESVRGVADSGGTARMVA